MAAIMIEERQVADRPEIRQRQQSTEDNGSILSSVESLRSELDFLHNKFNQATEPVLIDSIIYEIQAVQMRYTYYLEICKERGLISEKYSFTKREGK